MLNPSVQIHEIDGVMVAEFWDCLRLDHMPIQTLSNRFENWLKSGGCASLVIDLSGVGFAGSMAIGAFLKLHRAAKARRGRLIFCNVDPNVLEVFRITRVDPFFKFVNDVPAALNLVKELPPSEDNDNDDDGDANSTNTIPPSSSPSVSPPTPPPLSRLRRRNS